MRRFHLLLYMMALAANFLSLRAQIDMTSYITNPSFENDGLSGWTSTGMGTQGNSVFNIKDGTTYLEKWTGRGGAVGSGSVSQELQNLPAGNYELRVYAFQRPGAYGSVLAPYNKGTAYLYR
jgi:hypothetical protein